MTDCEAANKAQFSEIRYAQCWEDADVLLEGLAIRPGEHCLAIASAGDNALAMLTRNPGKVIAIDLNPSQLHCLELRVAAYKSLDYEDLLVLMGSRPGHNRLLLYKRCRPLLSAGTARFWDAHPRLISAGIGGAGKFEKYFAVFRVLLLGLIQSRANLEELIASRSREERQLFFDRVWNNRRWHFVLNTFFSRFVMGKLGRDPRFFDYVEASLGRHVQERTRYALTELEPDRNPYLQWIVFGRHVTALPLALRPESFDTIRDNIDRLEWRLCSLESFCETAAPQSVSRFNLSNIFEYMSVENYHRLLGRLLDVAAPGGRMAYWNMLVPRSRPAALGEQLQPVEQLSSELERRDKAFFYSRFIVEEVIPCRSVY